MIKRNGTLLFSRYALIGIAIIITVGFILFGYHYQKTYKTMADFTLTTMLKNANQASLNISNILSNVENLSQFFLRNSTVYNILSKSGESPSIDKQLNDFKALKTLSEVIYEGKNVYAFRIFLTGNVIYSREGISFFDIDNIPFTGMGSSQKNSSDLILKTGWTNLYQETYLDKPSANVITYIRCLRDEEDYNKITAAVALDILQETFIQLLSPIAVENALVFLLNQEGQVLATAPSNYEDTFPIITKENISQLMASKNGIFQSNNNGGSFYFIHCEVPDFNWQVAIMIPSASIHRGNSFHTMLLSFILIFSVVVLVISIVFFISSFLMRSILQNIKEMAQQVESGDLNFTPSHRNRNQYLDQIETHIKQITKSVHELEKENYLNTIKERDYQLKVLQAQIQPHLLYNTLDTIKWMAVKNKASGIEELTTSLAKYFRLSLGKGRDIVSLEDELELVRAYILIQQVRFSYPVTMVCNIDKSLLDCVLPKFTLQPIVENALLHGILNNGSGNGTITLSANKREEFIEIKVSDNGVGMTEEKVQSLMVNNSKSKGYGLRNVEERIQLHHGPNYGLQIVSQPGEGTTVIIKIPYCKS